MAHELLRIAQLCRERAECENSFDALKNQWGWGGYTTHDMHRRGLAAKNVALIYNGWSCFVRLATPKARPKAITSRPFLLYAIGRKSHHAAKTHLAKACCTKIPTFLGRLQQTATRLAEPECWRQIIEHIIALVIATKPPPRRLLLPWAIGN